jgi:geranylgeranyl pyrophosphate synthase
LRQEKVISITQLINSNWENSDVWPELIEAMRLVLPVGKGGSDPSKDPNQWALLPELCCQAAGGDPDATKEVSAAWLLLYIAAHIVDDVEDGDLTDDVRTLGGASATINVANGLFLSASLFLNKLHEKKQTNKLASQISTDFYKTILLMSSGQHVDITNQRMSLEQWWQVAEAKSGSFFSLACRVGAQLGIDDPEKIKGYSDYGHHLGVMLQIVDDLEDLKPLFSSEENHQPINIQKSLAMAYAFDVLPQTDREKLKEWTNATPCETYMVNGIVELLNRCGAGLYMLAEVERHYESGMTSLKKADPCSPAGDKLAVWINALKLD